VTSSKVGLVLAVLAASTVGGAQGQRAPALQVGAPVRITGLDVPGSPLTGMYAGRVGDTVLIGIPGGTDALRVPRRAITHLEVQLGMRSGAARTSVLGLLAGTAAAGAVALAVRARIRPVEGLGVVLAGGAVGTMAGGLAGQTMFRAPRWVEAPLEMLDVEDERP
jgi:hypothetical protein